MQKSHTVPDGKWFLAFPATQKTEDPFSRAHPEPGRGEPENFEVVIGLG